MKKYFFMPMMIFAGLRAFSQTPQADTNYMISVTSLTWMPDGKNILLSVVKHHKTDHNSPFFLKVLQYDLQSKKLNPVMDNGSNLAPSPDGNMIAYMKRNDDTRADIYLYNLESKQETLFKTDTSRKSALSWSPDGTKLVYNKETKERGRDATLDIYIADRQQTRSKKLLKAGIIKAIAPYGARIVKRSCTI